ncbi:MAG TPA: hypothetical protein VGA44_05950 [Steroidobacteraceae bacterium]
MSDHQITLENLRDRIWQAIRNRLDFTVSDIHADIIRGSVPRGVVRSHIYQYVRLLERAGYLERCGHVPGKRSTCLQVLFRLRQDVGVERPMLTTAGTLSSAGVRRERLWRTIKILKEFSLDELAAHASTHDLEVSRAAATRFVRALTKASYLVVTRRASARSVRRWRAVPSKVRGPHTPRYRRRDQVLFDPNTGEAIRLGDGDE